MLSFGDALLLVPAPPAGQHVLGSSDEGRSAADLDLAVLATVAGAFSLVSFEVAALIAVHPS